jgi:hypothetical protein
MAYVSTIEVLGAHARLRRTLAPPVRRFGLDTRIHSRRAMGLALKRTAVPTQVLSSVQDPSIEIRNADNGTDDDPCGDDPDRRRPS